VWVSLEVLERMGGSCDQVDGKELGWFFDGKVDVETPRVGTRKRKLSRDASLSECCLVENGGVIHRGG